MRRRVIATFGNCVGWLIGQLCLIDISRVCFWQRVCRQRRFGKTLVGVVCRVCWLVRKFHWIISANQISDEFKPANATIGYGFTVHGQGRGPDLRSSANDESDVICSSGFAVSRDENASAPGTCSVMDTVQMSKFDFNVFSVVPLKIDRIRCEFAHFI